MSQTPPDNSAICQSTISRAAISQTDIFQAATLYADKPMAAILWLADDAPLCAGNNTESGEFIDKFTPELINRLAPDEQATFAGIKSGERRHGFLFSRLMLRRILSVYLAPDKIQFQRADSGRLLLAGDTGWHISLSHAKGSVAVIVSSQPCGIDIEISRPVALANIVRRFFSASERTTFEAAPGNQRADLFFRLWTLKEASVKALGEGLADNLSRLAFDVSTDTPRTQHDMPALQLWQQYMPPHYYLAAAVKGDAPVQWHVQRITANEL